MPEVTLGGRTGHWRVYTRSGSSNFQIELRLPGEKKLRFSADTKDREQAEQRALKELEAQLGVRFQSVCEEFFERAEIGPNTETSYLSAMRKLHPYVGDLSLQQITPDLLQGYITDRKAEGQANATIRRDLAFLSSVFSWAQAFIPGAPELNPVRKVLGKTPGRKAPLQPAKRKRFLTRKEVDALKKATTEPVHAALIEFAVQTGMRIGEMLASEWNWLDDDLRVLELPEEFAKNGEPRCIVLSDTARDTLCGLPRSEDTPRIWLYRRWDGVLVPMTTIRKWWTGARRRSGVKDVVFHDLRHTHGSWWRRAGGLDAHMRNNMGHLTPEMSDRYAHLDVTGVILEMQRLGMIAQNTVGTQSQFGRDTEEAKMP